MATYQSVQTTPFSASASVTITKPVSLAVGDLMIASLVGFRNAVGTFAPGAWTEIDQEFSATAGEDLVLAIFSKVADAGDVAASNFTFTCSAADRTGGSITRITDYGSVTNFFINAAASADVSVSVATSITPTRVNSLLLMYTAMVDNTTLSNTTSAHAIQTDNPSWTERYDFNVSTSGQSGSTSMATATRSQMTALGNVTYTEAFSGDSQGRAVIVISPRVDGSVTPGDTKVNGYALSPIPTTQVNAQVDNPSYRTRTLTGWQNETKPSTSWNNETI